jgi:hypothetical protein
MMAPEARSEGAVKAWYARKAELMERSLGKQHDVVMHAIIPYAVGGPLDLYYYPHCTDGTAIATSELSESRDDCSSNDYYDCYELVMFTRYRLDLDVANDINTEFGRAHTNIGAILNPVARYSAQASLNPSETSEFPADMPQVGGKCFIFDGYACHDDDLLGRFGLLAVIEIFRSELAYARSKGGDQLIALLKAKGHYPRSDLDRQPVA